MTHLWPAKPIQVLQTSGTDFDIGKQHAEWVGDVIEAGMVGFYGSFWERMLSNKPKSFYKNAAFTVIQKLIDPGLIQRLVKQVPPHIQDRLLGVAAGSSMSFQKFATPLVLPDLLPMLQAYAGRLGAVNFVDVSPPPLFGCSSFVHNGNKFLQGRNLDFPGVGYWDRYPVIQTLAPKNTLRYIAFTTAGVPIAGITGINEAQISVALHQHYCFETYLKGQLPFVIGENILRKAKTLEEALEILRGVKVASSWAFVVADGKKRKAFIYETHPSASGIRWLDEKNKTLTHSNFYQTSEPKKKEYATTERMVWDNYCRDRRLKQLIHDSGDNFDIPQAIKAISDHWDPYWESEKIMNRTVSQIYNIQSLVWDLENMKAYVAEGNAPVQLGRYQEYDMGTLFSGRDGKTGKSFEGFVFENSEMEKAKFSFIHSFIHCFEGNNDKALAELDKTLALKDFPEARLISGLLSLKEGNYLRACEMFSSGKSFLETDKEASQRPCFPPEYFEIWLYWARSMELLGKRDEAVREYREIETHPDLRDKNIKNIVQRKKIYRKENLEQMIMPYSSYIPFS